MNPAEHAVRNGSCNARDLLRVDRQSRFRAEQSYGVADRDGRAVRDVDSGQIIEQRLESNGLTFDDHPAFIREPVWNSVSVTGGENGDSGSLRRPINAAIADQRAGRQVFDSEHRGFPGQRRLDVQQSLGSGAFGDWRNITIDGMARPHHPLPSVRASMGYGRAAAMPERRISLTACDSSAQMAWNTRVCSSVCELA